MSYARIPHLNHDIHVFAEGLYGFQCLRHVTRKPSGIRRLRDVPRDVVRKEVDITEGVLHRQIHVCKQEEGISVVKG